MATHDNIIPIRFYIEFWRRDFPAFPVEVQDRLGAFLEELQADPEERDLLGYCQRSPDDEDCYGCTFCKGYVVFWQLIREPLGNFIELSSRKVIRIDVLEARPVST